MSQTLRDFIAAREDEIKKHMAALRVDLGELRAAKSAIISADGGPDHSAAGGEATRKTHRDLIVEVLKSEVDGATSDKIIDMVRKRFSVDIRQASMSSQLSRANADGILTLEASTKIWRLAKPVDDGGGSACDNKNSGSSDFENANA